VLVDVLNVAARRLGGGRRGTVEVGLLRCGHIGLLGVGVAAAPAGRCGPGGTSTVGAGGAVLVELGAGGVRGRRDGLLQLPVPLVEYRDGVAAPVGRPAGVLLRGLEPVEGVLIQLQLGQASHPLRSSRSVNCSEPCGITPTRMSTPHE
jgi:hypothetical protein